MASIEKTAEVIKQKSNSLKEYSERNRGEKKRISENAQLGGKRSRQNHCFVQFSTCDSEFSHFSKNKKSSWYLCDHTTLTGFPGLFLTLLFSSKTASVTLSFPNSMLSDLCSALLSTVQQVESLYSRKMKKSEHRSTPRNKIPTKPKNSYNQYRLSTSGVIHIHPRNHSLVLPPLLCPKSVRLMTLPFHGREFTMYSVGSTPKDRPIGTQQPLQWPLIKGCF